MLATDTHFFCAKCGQRFEIIQRPEGQRPNNPDEGNVPVCDGCFKQIMDKMEKANGT